MATNDESKPASAASQRADTLTYSSQPSLYIEDYAEHINGQTLQIFYHGGCPDGCLAAIIMEQALTNDFMPVNIELLATYHSDCNASAITEGSTAIFVDVSPTAKDKSQLQRCRCVIILDHHTSAWATAEELAESLPMVNNLSDVTGNECGATLAAKFCKSQLVPTDIMHLFHKLDVFSHPIPENVAEKFDAFKGFITQLGLGKCTIELVKEFLADVGAALVIGMEFHAKARQHTIRVFEGRRLVIELDVVSVWAVRLENPDSLDLPLYQSLIDQLTTSKVVVFVTCFSEKQANGLWSLGLRRAGDGVDVGFVARELGTCSELMFKTGGGHPYAAGAQHENADLSTETVCQEIAQICERILTEKSVLP